MIAAKLHLAFFVRHSSRLLEYLVVVAICIALVWTFGWQWVIALRYALIAHCGLGAVAVLVDTVHFPGWISTDAASIVAPAIYFGYFCYSTRVRAVFKDQNWHPQVAG